MLRVWSAVLATLLCLATTQFAVQVSAIKATSLKFKANPNVDLKLTKEKRDFLQSSFRPDNSSVFGFYVDVVVGTPPQFFSLAFSSSSTTWLPAPNITRDQFCDTIASGNKLWACFYDHFFEPKKSSSFVKLPGVLDNYYGPNLFAKGTWGSDIFKINQLTISNVSFGLASNWTNGAELGLGVEMNRKVSPYPSIPEAMAQQGHINSVLYSIYVNEIQHDGGELYFGAVDDAKYKDVLRTFEGEKVGQVPVNGVYWIDTDGTNTSLVGASSQLIKEVGELQLGTPSLWLPNEVYRALVNSIPGLTYATAYDAYMLDCSIDDSQLGKLQFNIDGTIIEINARQMLVAYPAGGTDCVLTVYQNEKTKPDSPSYLLGSPFLRSAFSVWDYTNNQTSIAQSIPNTARSIVRAVPRGGIADLPPPENPISDGPSGTSLMPGPTSTEVGNPEGGSSGSSSNTGAIVGGTVGGVAFLAIAGALAWFFMKRKKGEAAPNLPFAPTEGAIGAPPLGPPDGFQSSPYVAEQFKPQMSVAQHQHPYPGQPIQTSPHNGYDTWGTAMSGDSEPQESITSGGTYPPAHDLSSYAMNGNPRQSGQQNYASEMPAHRYNY